MNISLKVPVIIACLVLLLLLSVQSASSAYTTDHLILDYEFTAADNATTIIDSSASHLNAVNHNTSAALMGSGFYNRSFNGIDGYLDAGTSNVLNPSTEITIVTLVKFRDVNGNLPAIAQHLTSTGGWMLDTWHSDSNKINFWLRHNSTISTTKDSTSAPLTDVWYIIFSEKYSNGTVRLYVNNVKQGADGTWDYTFNSDVTNTFIGRYSSFYGNFDMAYFRLYDKALNDTERIADYADSQQYIYNTAGFSGNGVTMAEPNTDYVLNIPVSSSFAYDMKATINYTLNNVSGSYIFLGSNSGEWVGAGDSLTAGTVVVPYNSIYGYGGYVMPNLAGWNYSNVGVGGRTTRDGINNYTADVASRAPVTMIEYEFGTNDLIWSHVTDPTIIEANDTIYFNMAIANGSKLIICAIPPSSTYNDAQDACRVAVNAWRQNYADTHGYGYINLSSILADPNNPRQLNPSFDYGDHIHINAAGYAAWGAATNVSWFVNDKTVEFYPGDSSKNIQFIIPGDNHRVSNNTQFYINLSGPVNTVLSTNVSYLVTVTEKDTLTFTISANTTSVTDSDTSINLTITKNLPADWSSSVSLSTINGTAVSGTDFTAINNQTFNFGQDDLNKYDALSINSNGVGPWPKTFTVELQGENLGDPHVVEITILAPPLPEDQQSINDLFLYVGTILDGFGTLMPHLLHLLVKLFPLALIAMLISLLLGIPAVVLVFVVLPKRMGVKQ